jgi:integron integrase
MPAVPTGTSPKLLDRLRAAIRARHYSRRTEKAYVGWVRRYILFSGLQHPGEFDERQVLAFVTMLARDRRISASTQNQALCAVLFLYRHVLDRPPEWGATLVRAHRPVRLPLVLSKSEVAAVLRPLRGPVRLVCELLYGSGLRLLEALTLRIKDVDFDRGEVRVRDGKGRIDRVTMLPARMRSSLVQHLETTRRQHEVDVLDGAGFVALPDGLTAKYPRAGQSWAWQWVFPATRGYVDRVTGERRRHHLHESVVQRAFHNAVLASGVPKPASCHSLRHHADSRIMPMAGSAGALLPLVGHKARVVSAA